MVAMANDTEFGLAAYFYTDNVQRTWRVALMNIWRLNICVQLLADIRMRFHG